MRASCCIAEGARFCTMHPEAIDACKFQIPMVRGEVKPNQVESLWVGASLWWGGLGIAAVESIRELS